MTDSLGYLLGRAAVVEQRVRELVAERRAADPAPDEPFSGPLPLHPALTGLIIDLAGYRTDLSRQLAHALGAGVRLIYLKERVAALCGAGLVAGPIEQVAEPHADVVRRLAETDLPLLLFGTSTWDPQWSTRNPLAVDAPVLTVANGLERTPRAGGAGGTSSAS